MKKLVMLLLAGTALLGLFASLMLSQMYLVREFLAAWLFIAVGSLAFVILGTLAYFVGAACERAYKFAVTSARAAKISAELWSQAQKDRAGTPSQASRPAPLLITASHVSSSPRGTADGASMV